ncbi:hypothetical protein [Nakamurella leprariae]|uniref:Uncharacterized protein n=1 Tax=Nakamurella leprariae TaxID=2803911 RepID=A0A938Y4Z5_9ACTN|nr:hypothetical protein [Nakamurella leprariae]MBM9465855.1 hypothetical protein [Nakamurella leprariae]
MPPMFHVSSVRNRASIQRHGLDWTRMLDAPGIAGSREPEATGVYLVPDRFTAQFFVRLNNTGGPVDVWTVDDVPADDLVVDDCTGFGYVPYRIGRDRLTLHDRDLPPPPPPPVVIDAATGSGRVVGALTITSADGIATEQPLYLYPRGSDG